MIQTTSSGAVSSSTARSGLTPDTFANLLARLGPDADQVGSAYEHLRRALVGFFTWRGAATPEECADVTLDRLATRLDEGLAVADVPRFARGIARRVLLEHWRRPDAERVRMTEAVWGREATTVARDDDDLPGCLHRALLDLSPGERALILEYYAGEGRDRIETRKRMARALAVSESALRSRAQRLRDRLERSITRFRASSHQNSLNTAARGVCCR
jgi:DNA-directed RNA polymerase specialized sigma24 family protein